MARPTFESGNESRRPLRANPPVKNLTSHRAGGGGAGERRARRPRYKPMQPARSMVQQVRPVIKQLVKQVKSLRQEWRQPARPAASSRPTWSGAGAVMAQIRPSMQPFKKTLKEFKRNYWR